MQNLKDSLAELHSERGPIMLKGGTDWEDQDPGELEFLHDLGAPRTPRLVKIGGPEARTDLRNLRAIGVGAVLGPMVESEYALQKFVTTVREVYEGADRPALAINLETRSGVDNLGAILANPSIDHVELVVIGRLDLAASLGRSDVDDGEVTRAVRQIVDRVRARAIPVSVGGYVDGQSAPMLQKQLDLTHVNTLHTLLDLTRTRNVTRSVQCRRPARSQRRGRIIDEFADPRAWESVLQQIVRNPSCLEEKRPFLEPNAQRFTAGAELARSLEKESTRTR